MKKTLFFFFILSVSLVGTAQDQKITTVTFDKLLYAGINPAGELYTASSTKLTRYDKNGTILKEVVLPTVPNISQFDSWHLTQFVVYYRKAQRVEIYNPEIELRSSFVIDSAFAIEPQFIAASYDQKNFWIFDKADGSLKKVNYETGEVLLDEVISAFNITQKPPVAMREYQRFLFLKTATTLFVFNSMGKHIHSFALQDQQNFDFFGEEFFLLTPRELQFTSLFTLEKRSVPVAEEYEQVLLTDDRFYGIRKNTIDFWGFTPN